jgi:hypothetical protein
MGSYAAHRTDLTHRVDVPCAHPFVEPIRRHQAPAGLQRVGQFFNQRNRRFQLKAKPSFPARMFRHPLPMSLP